MQEPGSRRGSIKAGLLGSCRSSTVTLEIGAKRGARENKIPAKKREALKSEPLWGAILNFGCRKAGAGQASSDGSIPEWVVPMTRARPLGQKSSSRKTDDNYHKLPGQRINLSRQVSLSPLWYFLSLGLEHKRCPRGF